MSTWHVTMWQWSQLLPDVKQSALVLSGKQFICVIFFQLPKKPKSHLLLATMKYFLFNQKAFSVREKEKNIFY